MMKTLLLSAACLGSISLNAQSFQLAQLTDNMPAAASYTFNVASGDPTFSYEFIVRNVTSNTIAAKVRRTILSAPVGHDIYYCFGTTCYTPVTSVSTTVAIGGNQELPNGVGTYGIRTEFDNGSVLGQSMVRYSVFDANNPVDTAVVYITYNVQAVGITSFNTPALQTKLFPNPAQDHATIEYDATTSDGNLSVSDALGRPLISMTLAQGSSSTDLDVSGLLPGLYYYTVTCGVLRTQKKFMVTR